jgi:hypothetical protein
VNLQLIRKDPSAVVSSGFIRRDPEKPLQALVVIHPDLNPIDAAVALLEACGCTIITPPETEHGT